MESHITLPYKSLIKGGVYPGKSFSIKGVVNPNAKRIHFNLRHRFGIAFHYNPRFDENKVVCNTWDGQWGEEEHHNGTPFKEGQPFETVPYKTIINGGLFPGKNILIQGIINPHANRIAFNLRHRSGIAFHYNPRFDENVVVRNSHHMERWAAEERLGGMPFHRGQHFQVTISCNPHHYNVFVNGQQTHTFKHRYTNLHEIDILEVTGDLQLTLVQA